MQQLRYDLHEAEIILQVSFLRRFDYKENGVNRSMMKTTLFEEREIEDISHSIRNIIYNAKKRLKSFGVPDGTLITQKNGVYFWTGEVSVEEDASNF